LENDQVGVPASLFRKPPTAILSSQRPSTQGTEGGRVERIENNGNVQLLTGWAAWEGVGAERELLIVQHGDQTPLKINFITDQERWDRVASTQDDKQLLTGFVLSIQGSLGFSDHRTPCIYSRSGHEQPWQRLSGPGALEACESKPVQRK
jgi:hypothetical protein